MEETKPHLGNEFPKWRHHPKLASVIVNTPDEEEAQTPASKGWTNRPQPKSPAAKPQPVDIDRLIGERDGLKLQVTQLLSEIETYKFELERAQETNKDLDQQLAKANLQLARATAAAPTA